MKYNVSAAQKKRDRDLAVQGKFLAQGQKASGLNPKAYAAALTSFKKSGGKLPGSSSSGSDKALKSLRQLQNRQMSALQNQFNALNKSLLSIMAQSSAPPKPTPPAAPPTRALSNIQRAGLNTASSMKQNFSLSSTRVAGTGYSGSLVPNTGTKRKTLG